MPLEQHRRAVAERVRATLLGLEWVDTASGVVIDEWDSTEVYIRFNVKVETFYERPFAFHRGTNPTQHKADVGQLLRQHVTYRWVDWPSRVWEYVSVHSRCPGDPARRFIGWDGSQYCIAVSV